MKSLNFKFIAIFLILVLVATIIFATLFLALSSDKENKEIEERLDKIATLLVPTLEEYLDLDLFQNEIEELIKFQKSLGITEQIFVVSKNKILASGTGRYLNEEADNYLEASLLVFGESSSEQSAIVSIGSEGKTLRVFDKVFPIKKIDNTIGLLYIRYDLSSYEKNISDMIALIVLSVSIALSITFVLAIIVASSITKPINMIKEQAERISKGESVSNLEIRSNDEIGKLAGTFNYMAEKLELSIEEVQREKTKLEIILNNMADGLLASTINGEILHLNPMGEYTLCNIGIYDRRNYIDISKFLPEELKLDNITSLGSSKRISVEIMHNEFSYEIELDFFHDEKGEREGFILVFKDITKEANLEKMRRDFIANVSHELKTPITSIKSYTETILSGAVNDENTRDRFLDVVFQEASRMERIVYDLLQLSNMDSSNIKLELAQHFWDEFIRNTIDKLKIRADEKNIKIKFENKAGRSLKSKFDINRMEQVLVNLIVNAINYTPENGSVRVSIEKNTKIIINVEDTGIGIPQKDIKNIFKRFYRIEKSRDRAKGGSGLGLSIVKQIIELHRGEIFVKSEHNKGSKFTIILDWKS